MKIGIIGGGQLAQMLTLAAKDLNHEALCFCEPTEPASLVCETQRSNLKNFDRADVLAIENEFLDLEALPANLDLSPTRPVIELYRDKLKQKYLLKKLHILTADFEEIDAKTNLIELLDRYTSGVALKWSLFGYDGKGTFFLRKPQDVDEASEFIAKGHRKGAQVYAEELIAFDKEVSLVSAKSKEQFFSFPIVETIQESGTCKEVEALKNSKLQETATRVAQTLANETRIIGTFAIEFFLKDERLFVNEIAPRVHNSGHWTQVLPMKSQFHYHIYALTDSAFPAVPPSYPEYYGMLNLLSPSGLEKTITRSALFQNLNKDLYLNWYGKSELKPGRKMGHINYFSSSESEFRSLQLQARSLESTIWENLYSRGVPV